jgi:hypothetical protein
MKNNKDKNKDPSVFKWIPGFTTGMTTYDNYKNNGKTTAKKTTPLPFGGTPP